MTSTLPRIPRYIIVFVLGLILGIAAYARIGPNATSLDPGLQAALLLIVSVILAATAGAAGAAYAADRAADAALQSARLSNTTAVATLDHARQARLEDRRDARLDRFADRKLSLAVDLLLTSDKHHEESAQQVAAKDGRFLDSISFAEPTVTTIPDIDTSQPVRSAWLALQLMAPALAKEATRLYMATTPLGELAAGWAEPSPHSGRESWTTAWTSAEREYNDARIAFVDACHRDLGVDAKGAGA